MQKFSDAMEVQESLVHNYVEIKEIMTHLDSKLSCKKLHYNDVVERSQSAAVHIRQNGFAMLPRVHPVVSSKVIFLGLKRRAALKIPSKSLKDSRDGTETLDHLDQRTTTVIHDDAPANLSHRSSVSGGGMVRDRVSTEVEPVDQAEAVLETPPGSQPLDEFHPEEAVSHTEQSWLRKLVTIKDSALVLHKDFRGAR